MTTKHVFPPRSILVPTDLGPASKSALLFARSLHRKFGAAVSVLHAEHIELPPYFSSAQLGELKRELKRLSRNISDIVREECEPILGFRPDVRVVESTPVEAILEQSQDSHFDLIVMGMNGHSKIERLWMGSVTERIIRLGSKPVLAVRSESSKTTIESILCPMSPSEPGNQALEYAAGVSKEFNAELTVLHVVEKGEGPLTCPLVDEQIKKTCRVKEISFHGNAAKTIAEAANDLKPNLLVIGAERKNYALGEIFSSTTAGVMQLAIGPLLVVPRARE